MIHIDIYIIYSLFKSDTGLQQGSNRYYLLYNAEDLKTLLEVCACVKANVHVRTHTQKRKESA